MDVLGIVDGIVLRTTRGRKVGTNAGFRLREYDVGSVVGSKIAMLDGFILGTKSVTMLGSWDEI